MIAKMKMSVLIVTGLIFFLGILGTAFAIDPGFELAKSCRAHLTVLNAATKKCIADGTMGFPTWDTFEHVYTMLLSTKYVPQKPTKPTPDCEYFIVFMNVNNYDWYCNLHGVESGDRSITIRYHEYSFPSKVNSKYMSIPKYKSHYDNIVRWVGYTPTLWEDVKYRYTRNPLTTIIYVIFGVLAAYFTYKNIYGP